MKDFRKILGREVDGQNRTIFIIENMDGEQESVLYSELDMKKVRNMSSGEKVSAIVVKRADGERLVIKSKDEENKVVDIAIEKDKFLHPEKYGKEK